MDSFTLEVLKYEGYSTSPKGILNVEEKLKKRSNSYIKELPSYIYIISTFFIL